MSDNKTKEDDGGLTITPSYGYGEVGTRRLSCQDAVFGDIGEGGPNYRAIGWLGTAAIMTKTQIGLGVLSIPANLDILGLIPGIILLWVIAIITTWTDYMVGAFKLRHPDVYSIDDVGQMIFGRVGREVLAITFCLFWIFCSGSGMLGISIALNAVSTHGTCTVVFVAVAAILVFCLASIQTLGKISWLAWVGCASIITAILVVTVAVGVESRPAAAPQTGPWTSDYKLIKHPTFTQAISAIASYIFSYAGTPGFFAIVAEMREPRQYTRSMFLCQSVVTALYTTIGIVVYYYCGSYVASPALGSAGHLMKKVSYGLAIPGLTVSTVILTHYPAKYIFVRTLRGTKHLSTNSMIHWVCWLSCTAGCAIIAFIIASAIPVFGGLVSLVGALLGTLMCFQPMGCMWLYDHWSEGKTKRSAGWIFMVCWSVFVIVSGTFLMIGGTYGSIVGIMDSLKAGGGSSSFSCADNSNST